MKDDRLRIPVEAAYVGALGLAAYAFARLEWDAVWCCERMSPDIIYSSLPHRTAGAIADQLIKLAKKRSATETDDLLAAAEQFGRLVNTRNALLHAKPGTDEVAQRLFQYVKLGKDHFERNGQPWTVETINDAADEFTACSNRLNAMLHGPLHASSGAD
jgi:hypothetical protein